MHKRIVYNRKDDGGVSVCCPSEWIFTVMCNGGAWPDFDWYYPGFADVQIERMIAEGIRQDVAVRHADAMMRGGLTTAEVWELIRDRDCEPHGTAIELWDVAELPADRWFRNAWRRSPNGGPIYVKLELAQPIQFERARSAVKRENDSRDALLRDWQPPLEVDWHAIRRQILRVGSIEELRTIWPEGI